MVLVGAPLLERIPLSEFQRLIIRLFSVVGVFLQVLIFSRFVDRDTLSSFGFNSRISRKEFYYSTLGVGIIIIVGFSLLLVSGHVEVQSVSFQLYPFLQSILFFLLVAFGEELAFRGYLLKNLLQSTNEATALLISAVMFAFVHLMNPNIGWIGFFHLILSGLLLGIAWLYRRNIWLPVSIHFFWNFIQTQLGFDVSGNPNYSVVVTKLPYSSVWNGGEFGFEGSVLCVVMELVAVYWFWLLYRKKVWDLA